jgi:hypothetical protein
VIDALGDLGKTRRMTRIALRLLALRVRLPRELQRTSLPTVLARVAPVMRARNPSPSEIIEARSAIALAERMCRRARVIEDTCLFQSIARYAVWRRLGVPARFVMGVRRDATAAVEGHAWVESDGVPDGGERVSDYVVTFAYPE